MRSLKQAFFTCKLKEFKVGIPIITNNRAEHIHLLSNTNTHAHVHTHGDWCAHLWRQQWRFLIENLDHSQQLCMATQSLSSIQNHSLLIKLNLDFQCKFGRHTLKKTNEFEWFRLSFFFNSLQIFSYFRAKTWNHPLFPLLFFTLQFIQKLIHQICC